MSIDKMVLDASIPENENTNFIDRDPINNIWDQEQTFKNLKIGLRQESSQEKREEIESAGKMLLRDADPYKVKIGIQLMRLLLWETPAHATEWVTDVAPTLSQHAHPRIRHSNLWNIRSSVWQDSMLAPEALTYAQKGLIDSDPAVQRVSMWTHGDAVINDPSLYSAALDSMNAFLENNPKESNYLFALEEFYGPIQNLFSSDARYREQLQKIQKMNAGYPGVQGRCAAILGDEFVFSDADKNLVKVRLGKSLANLPESVNASIGDYAGALQSITAQFAVEDTFVGRMKKLWTIRDLLWATPGNNEEVFVELAATLSDMRDGDLIRTTSVVLADIILKNPEALAEIAIKTVEDFYQISDIDGSQIVIAQMLSSLRSCSDRTRQLLNDCVSKLQKKAANKSVSYTLASLTTK